MNTTRMATGYNVGLEASGRELLVVVVKGTFTLPRTGEPATLHDEQAPLVMAEVFSGEPGKTAPLYETDFAPRKQRCDVLLVGSACAPSGHPVRHMRVRMKVGPIDKETDVFGDRIWRSSFGVVSVSTPEPFDRMPLSYDRAFGGTIDGETPDGESEAYLPNPVGRGWHRNPRSPRVDGVPLPNLEVPGRGVRLPSESYPPVAFGPVGRGWPQRARFAGTYDQHWLDNVFPFLPTDFDERYYQAAPEDQQMSIPTGHMRVELHGVTADGVRAFTLPSGQTPVAVFPKRGEREAWNGVLDTIVFEPDAERVTLTWRVTRPLKRSIFEIARVQVGVGGHEAWHAPNPGAAVAGDA